MILNNKLDYVAFHEAGHAVAHFLTGIPFKYVTIKADKAKEENGQRSLGHVMLEKPVTADEWCQYSMLNPDEFNIYLKNDFTNLAGLVAEMIYRGRFNYKGAKGDFRFWINTTLGDLPEKLSSKYQSFILEYTFQVLQIKTNWSNITAVALALIDEETLSYDQFLEVIRQNAINSIPL